MRDLTVVIIAGGKGSRSADPKLPKVLQQLDASVSLLDLHLENISALQPRTVILALGHNSDLVLLESEKISKIIEPAKLLICLEDKPLGTAGALNKALNSVKTENILAIYGDTAIRTNYDIGFDIWIHSGKSIGVYCHPNLHPDDSDAFSFSNGHITGFYLKNQKKESNSPLRPLTGSFFAKASHLRKLLSSVGAGDITKQVYLKAWSEGELGAIRTSDFFMDTGTPDRLNLVRTLFENGATKRRGKKDAGVIFIDRDNCLIPDIPTGRKSIVEDEFERSTLAQIIRANQFGIKIFLVTNQPAIAKGFISVNEFESVQAEIEAILARNGAFLDDYAYCMHHPEAGHPGEILHLKIPCKCRKPRTGMIRSLSEFHQFNVSKSIVIGDSATDFGLGINLGSKVKIVKYGDGSTAKAIGDYVDSTL